MNKKSKLVAALAIGAVVLIIGSGVARCSITNATDDQNPSPVTQEQAAPGHFATDDKAGVKVLSGSSWTREDGAKLSLSDTTIVISEPEKTSVYYYTVDEESERQGALNATLSISTAMNGEQSIAVVAIVQNQDGSQTLTCDQLGGTFSRDAVAEVHIALTGSNDELYELFGHNKEDFEAALSEYARDKSPHATKATWDREAWIDYAAKTKLANFTLDDATSTFVTVMSDASGRLVAK